jgi:hypothetical protein
MRTSRFGESFYLNVTRLVFNLVRLAVVHHHASANHNALCCVMRFYYDSIIISRQEYVFHHDNLFSSWWTASCWGGGTYRRCMVNGSKQQHCLAQPSGPGYFGSWAPKVWPIVFRPPSPPIVCQHDTSRPMVFQQWTLLFEILYYRSMLRNQLPASTSFIRPSCVRLDSCMYLSIQGWNIDTYSLL